MTQRRRLPRAARPTPDVPLSRARILKTARTLLAQHGAGGLSMRTLADALGAAPMSLYRHVRSKDDLLRALVAMTLEQLDMAVPTHGPWTARAAAWMHALRNGLLRSPAVVSILVQHGHYTPALLRATNTLLQILRDAGFDSRDAVRASREIMWSTLGFVSAEVRGQPFSPTFYLHGVSEAERGAAGGLRPEEVAEVAAHMPHLLTRDLDDVFGAIVKHLLAGLAQELSDSASHVRMASHRRRA